MVGGIGGICQQRGEVISVKYRAEILSGDRNLLSRIYTSFGAPSPTRTASPHLGCPTIPTILHILDKLARRIGEKRNEKIIKEQNMNNRPIIIYLCYMWLKGGILAGLW